MHHALILNSYYIFKFHSTASVNKFGGKCALSNVAENSKYTEFKITLFPLLVNNKIIVWI